MLKCNYFDTENDKSCGNDAKHRGDYNIIPECKIAFYHGIVLCDEHNKLFDEMRKNLK